MDHLRFKSSHTAAGYVADELDAQTQEAFELHMMTCPECVGDVEAWRALKHGMANDTARSAADTIPRVVPHKSPAVAGRWRAAASFAAAGLVGAGGGWLARSAQGPWLDADRISFYSLPAVSRGFADCTGLQLGPRTRLVALRIPGAMLEQQLIAIDSDGHDLRADSYTVEVQGDGSWLVRLPSQTLHERSVRFETRSVDGTAEPVGCVVGVDQG